MQGTVTSIEELKDPSGNTFYKGEVTYASGKINGDFGNKAYAVGDSIDVFVDPANPSDAILNPLIKSVGYILMLLGCFMACVAVLVAFIFSTLSETGQAVVGGVQGATNLYQITRSF